MKKLISMLMCGMMVGSMAFAAPVEGTVPMENEEPTERFIEFMKPLYEGEVESYEFLNEAGEDITQQVLLDTQESAQKEDWASVDAYIDENVPFMSYETEKVQHTRAGNSIVKMKTFGATVKQVKPQASSQTRQVIWDLQATVNYDSSRNITSVNPISIKNVVITPTGRVKDENTGVSIASNKKSAVVYSNVTVGELSSYGGSSAYWTMVFENAHGEMTVTL